MQNSAGNKLVIWGGLGLVALMAFIPWSIFGVEPLIAGFVPQWIIALLVPYLVFVVLMAAYAGRGADR